MTRTLKLALAVSLAIHAAAFAVICIVSNGENKSRKNDEPHIVVLVPVQEDFIAKPVEAPPKVSESPPPSPTKPLKLEAPPIVETKPAPTPPVEVQKPKVPEFAPKAVEAINTTPVVATPPRTNVPVIETNIKDVAVAPARATTARNTEVKTNSLAAPALITGRVKYRQATDPEYPPLARRRHQEGTVLLEVTISPTGRPTAVIVKQSSSFPLLDRAALEAVQSWEFEVATDLPVRAEIPVRFQLVK